MNRQQRFGAALVCFAFVLGVAIAGCSSVQRAGTENGERGGGISGTGSAIDCNALENRDKPSCVGQRSGNNSPQ